MTKETTGLVTPTTENIPEQLTARRQSASWLLEERDGKPTKVPYTPETGVKASTTDLLTWRTFEDAMNGIYGADALRALGMPPYDGIGFVFCSADPFAGIDLDGCRDPESGAVAPWAQKIIDAAVDGYVEVSPSGTGVHIIVEGTVRGGGMRKGPIEMYSRGRFFTITGELL